jgi:hypothetical protein
MIRVGVDRSSAVLVRGRINSAHGCASRNRIELRQLGPLTSAIFASHAGEAEVLSLIATV